MIPGCESESSQSGSKPIAKVGNSELTLQEARQHIASFVYKNDSTTALLNYRDNWIRKQLLIQEAKRLNLDKKRPVQEKLQKARQEIYVQVLKDYILSSYEKELNISRKDARDFYQRNKDKFTLQERYIRYRHMATKDLSSAREAKTALMSGKTWKEVASDYHINPRKAIQHSDHFWPSSIAIKEVPIMNRFLDVIGISEISPIRRYNGKYHFVQLIEERPEGENPNLNWLLDQLEEWLRINKRKEHLNSYVRNLYLNAKANNEIETYNVFDTTLNNIQGKDSINTKLHENTTE